MINDYDKIAGFNEVLSYKLCYYLMLVKFHYFMYYVCE